MKIITIDENENIISSGIVPAHYIMQKNDHEVSDITDVVGNTYSKESGKVIMPEAEPPVTLTITSDKQGNVMVLGDTLSFNVVFSDLTINASVPISIVNRKGDHVSNAFVVVTNGVGVGTFTPDKPIDYFVTDEAINHHKFAIMARLSLSAPFYIRVIQA